MLKNIVLSLVILFSLLTCHSPEYQDSNQDRHFDINFYINQEKNGEASLTFEINVDSAYYFASPHSEGWHQRLIFSIEDTDSLLLAGELIEVPKTQVGYDNLSEKEGRFVRKNTTYSQNLILRTQNDFEVGGLIWLEMRPNCQPYEIRFVISNISGNIMIEKESISIAGYPTFWDKKRVDITSNNDK